MLSNLFGILLELSVLIEAGVEVNKDIQQEDKHYWEINSLEK